MAEPPRLSMRLEDLPEEKQKKIALNLHLTNARDTDELPTPEELDLVAQLRGRFPEEFARRKAEGRDYAPLFGDIFLTRVMRGCNGEIELATTWFTRYLENFERLSVDALYLEMTKQLDNNPDVPYGSAFMLPNAKDLKPYVNEIFHFPKPSAQGDMLNYSSWCDINMQSIAEACMLNKLARYQQGAALLRLIVLDRESRRQGRMVKTILLSDFAGSTTALFLRQKTKEEEEHQAIFSQFNESISAEVVRKICCLNSPWWAVYLWNVLQRYMPERLKAKILVLDGAGLEDSDFVQSIGGEAALWQMLLSRIGLIRVQASTPSGEVHISAKSSFEHSIGVTPGQMITWTTELLNRSGDFMMGASSITFSVLAKWAYSEDEIEARIERFAGQAIGEQLFLEEVVPEVELDPAQDQVAGSYRVLRAGVLVLRWSNERSMLRGKSIKYTTQVVEEPDTVENAFGDTFDAALTSFDASDIGVAVLRLISQQESLRQANGDVASPGPGPGALGQLVDKPSEKVDIRAGAFFEELISAVPGQILRWSFEVMKGHVDDIMGTSDIAFEVFASWIFEEGGERKTLPLSIAPEVRITPWNRAVSGSFEVPWGGSEVSGAFFEVVLRWSNEHSRLRAKSVKYALHATSADKQATSFGQGCWHVPHR